jgi:hypothetical protein
MLIKIMTRALIDKTRPVIYKINGGASPPSFPSMLHAFLSINQFVGGVLCSVVNQK